MKKINKTILPLGYQANGLCCGIKKSPKPDLGIIYSQSPGRAAGVFTANKIISGSVKFSKLSLKKSSQFQAIIANSGNANCFTGHDSFKKANDIASELARLLGIKKHEVLLASTGIIGKTLPAKRIQNKLGVLVQGLKKSKITQVAKAILTTDTFIKLDSARIKIGTKPVTICGLAKGAGMIAPNLIAPHATMLSFVLTDANISQAAINAALKIAMDKSFNCITVDGCMSTNDTVLLMSNACAGNALIKVGGPAFNKFSKAVNQVCLNLAKMIVQDAEGGTKFIQIKVAQAKTVNEAKRIALNIANSNLFKTAMFGSNDNIGRIVSAVGSTGVDVKESDLKVTTSPLKKKEIFVEVKLRRGKCYWVGYTSDLTPAYVNINAKYS